MILYKYLSRLETLTNGMLRFTQPSSFNDPFEVTPHIDALIERDKIMPFGEALFSGPDFEKEFFTNFSQVINQIIEEHNLPPEVAQLLKVTKPEEALTATQPLLMSIFSDFVGLNMDGMKDHYQDTLQKDLNSKFGLLCLTEKPDNELMWSHYADSHKGFAIGFKSDHPYFNQRKSDLDQTNFLQKVIYTKQRPSLAFFDPEADEAAAVPKLIQQIFLTKSLNWKYEKEWRMIKLLEGADLIKQVSVDQIYLFNYPIDSIDRVILGAKCPQQLKMDISKFISEKSALAKIKLYQCTLDRTTYKIKLGKVD